MAYNESLAERIRLVMQEKQTSYVEKKMMGGLTFMVDDKMCVGIVGEQLMARIGPDPWEAAIARDGVNEMMFTGRSMKGYVFVDPEAMDRDEELTHWIQLALDHNPLAKASKKRKKK